MPEPPVTLTYLQRAMEEGSAQLIGEVGSERIEYGMAGQSHRWAGPEEKIRAELWAELVYKYEYPRERIGIEVTVPGRVPSNRADLVVYEDDEQKSPYFVFECKRSDISDAAFDQSIEQACGYRASLGAKYCGVVAGLTRRLLRFDRFAPGERDRNHMTDIPVRYGRPPEWRFYKNEQGRDLAAVPREELRSAIRKCHQTLWEGGRRSPIAAFGEFSKIVFIKHRDEKDLRRENGKPYAFQRRDGETAAGLSDRVHQLYREEQSREPEVFTDSINVDPPILAQCVEHLEGISLDRTELDTKGVAFEEFMGGFFKGHFGQYFTPRELIAFAVELLGPERDNLILDPACGSGGFLLYALDHVRREADRRQTPGTVEHFPYWHEFAQNNLFGIEINDELARVAKMNMIIHDDGHTNIIGHDALDFPQNIEYKNRDLTLGKFDLVLTHPPFGSVIRRTEKGDGYLEQFDLQGYLGKNYPDPKAKRTSVKTEILFLERIHSFLKPGSGRAAVVLPDGTLTNSSLQGVRDWLLAHFQLLAVVSLPQFAFQHYDAGVKASIVFLRRLADDESVPDDAPIFMALAENIGYDGTGRKTSEVTVESESPSLEKIERHSCDLFDYRVTYEWRAVSPKEADWSERRREVIPGTGLVAQWREFQRDPTPFFRPPPEDFRHAFAVYRRGAQQRFDPHFHSPEFALIQEMLSQTQCESLGSIATFSKEIWRPQDHEQPTFRYVEISTVDPKTGEARWNEVPTEEAPSRARMAIQADDIIVSLTRPHHGSIAHLDAEFDGCVASTGFAVIREVAKHVRRDYLWCVLRAQFCLSQMLQRASGGSYPAITEQELANIIVPVPRREIQDTIATEVHRRRNEATRLRNEADANWQAAKQWFEEQLLRPNTL